MPKRTKRAVRDLEAAQRGADRVPLERAPQFPFVQLMAVCDEAGVVNVVGREIARVTQPPDADAVWHFARLLDAVELRVMRAVDRWVMIYRALAGDARVLTHLELPPATAL